MLVGAFVVYLPAFHDPTAFQTASLRPLFWTPHFTFALYIFLLNEGIKWSIRHRPNGWIANHMAW